MDCVARERIWERRIRCKDVKKYAKASDAFFDKGAAERLAWIPKSAGEWRTTKMSEEN